MLLLRDQFEELECMKYSSIEAFQKGKFTAAVQSVLAMITWIF